MVQVLAQELELDSFKSFGRKTIIPFREGFTTISGPNGSGKSNLVDAMLFCLGLSSSKSLRAESLPDFISNHNRKREARVAFRLSVEGRDEPLELARVVRLTRSGYTGTYYIDGRPVSRSAVHHRLQELGISPKGYNMIMQNDVTRIISMSPLERRRVIDELAGVAEFDQRIDEAREELTHAERHLEDTQLLLHELKLRLEALADEREQALRYRGLKVDKERLEAILIVLTLDATRAQLGGILRDREARKEERRGYEERKQALGTDLAQISEQMSGLQAEIRAKGEEERLRHLSRLEEIKGELKRIEDHRAHLRDEAGRRQNRARELFSFIEEAGGRDRRDVETRKGLEKEEADQIKAVEVRKQKINDLYSRIEKSNQDHALGLRELGRLRGEINDLRLNYNEVGHLRATYVRDLEENRKRHTTSTQRAAGLDEQLTELKSMHSDAEETRAELINEIEQSEHGEKDLETRLIAFKNRLERREGELRTAYRDYADAEARRQAAREMGGGRALKALFDANLRGIRGTVADLARVPQEHTAAIESAAGRRLEFVVVDDEHVAARAIEILKKAKAGRLTFLPLTKIRRELDYPPLSGQGVVDYAIKLVGYDPEYHAIFCYVLGKTVVIKDMRTGLPLIGRYRMVTREGDLLEMSGAMTGGSRPRHSRSRFPQHQLEEKARRVRELEQEIENLKSSVISLEQQKSSTHAYLGEARKQVATLDVQISRDAEEIKRLEGELKQARREAADLEKACERLEREVKAADRDLGARQKEIDAKEKDIAAVEEATGAAELKERGTQVTQLESDLRQAEADLLAIREKIRNLDLEGEFRQKNVADWKAELETAESELKSLQSELDTEIRREHELTAEKDAMGAEIQRLSDDVRELKDRRDAFSEKAEEIRRKQNALEAHIYRIESAVQQLDREEERLTSEIARLEEAVAETLGDRIPEEARTLNLPQARAQISTIEAEMKSLEPVNMLAIDQYADLEERHGELKEKHDAISAERQGLLDRMDRIATHKKQAFMKAFNGVLKSFESIYAELSEGKGELFLEDPENPFEGGLIIRAQPREKKMERMEAMSGGEKALTALAFVFAYQTYLPAPFYVFDEVDKDLDMINTELLARVIRRQSRNAQFIVVSHRRAMLERSQRTIGVHADRSGFSRVTGIEVNVDGEDGGENGGEGPAAEPDVEQSQLPMPDNIRHLPVASPGGALEG